MEGEEEEEEKERGVAREWRVEERGLKEVREKGSNPW